MAKNKKENKKEYYLVCIDSDDPEGTNPSKKAYTLDEAVDLFINIPLSLQSASREFRVSHKDFIGYEAKEARALINKRRKEISESGRK